MSPRDAYYRLFLDDAARFLDEASEAIPRVDAPVASRTDAPDARATIPWLGLLHSLKSLALAFSDTRMHLGFDALERWAFSGEGDPQALLADLQSCLESALARGDGDGSDEAAAAVTDSPGTDQSSPVGKRTRDSVRDTRRENEGRGFLSGVGADSAAELQIPGSRYSIRLFFRTDETLPLARLTVLLSNLGRQGSVVRIRPTLNELREMGSDRPAHVDVLFVSPSPPAAAIRLCRASGFPRSDISRLSAGADGSMASETSGGGGRHSRDTESWLKLQRAAYLRTAIHGKHSDAVRAALMITEPVAAARRPLTDIDSLAREYFSSRTDRPAGNPGPGNWRFESDICDGVLEPRALLAIEALLIHLINNSLDHGGEAPDPTIRLEIRQTERREADPGRLFLSYRDNGPWYHSGMGETGSNAALSEDRGTTPFSGRGLGMGIIASTAARLGCKVTGPPENPGALRMDFSREIIALPCGLHQGADGRRYAVVLESVVSDSAFSPSRVIRSPGGRLHYHVNGSAYPLVGMNAAEAEDAAEAQDFRAVQFRRFPGGETAVVVGRLLGEEDIFIVPDREQVLSADGSPADLLI
jgi:hypothetical protein